MNWVCRRALYQRGGGGQTFEEGAGVKFVDPIFKAEFFQFFFLISNFFFKMSFFCSQADIV
jgi:hypothetical protein